MFNINKLENDNSKVLLEIDVNTLMAMTMSYVNSSTEDDIDFMECEGYTSSESAKVCNEACSQHYDEIYEGVTAVYKASKKPLPLLGNSTGETFFPLSSTLNQQNVNSNSSANGGQSTTNSVDNANSNSEASPDINGNMSMNIVPDNVDSNSHVVINNGDNSVALDRMARQDAVTNIYDGSISILSSDVARSSMNDRSVLTVGSIDSIEGINNDDTLGIGRFPSFNGIYDGHAIESGDGIHYVLNGIDETFRYGDVLSLIEDSSILYIFRIDGWVKYVKEDYVQAATTPISNIVIHNTGSPVSTSDIERINQRIIEYRLSHGVTQILHRTEDNNSEYVTVNLLISDTDSLCRAINVYNMAIRNNVTPINENNRNMIDDDADRIKYTIANRLEFGHTHWDDTCTHELVNIEEEDDQALSNAIVARNHLEIVGLLDMSFPMPSIPQPFTRGHMEELIAQGPGHPRGLDQSTLDMINNLSRSNHDVDSDHVEDLHPIDRNAGYYGNIDYIADAIRGDTPPSDNIENIISSDSFDAQRADETLRAILAPHNGQRRVRDNTIDLSQHPSIIETNGHYYRLTLDNVGNQNGNIYNWDALDRSYRDNEGTRHTFMPEDISQPLVVEIDQVNDPSSILYGHPDIVMINGSFYLLCEANFPDDENDLIEWNYALQCYTDTSGRRRNFIDRNIIRGTGVNNNISEENSEIIASRLNNGISHIENNIINDEEVVMVEVLDGDSASLRTAINNRNNIAMDLVVGRSNIPSANLIGSIDDENGTPIYIDNHDKIVINLDAWYESRNEDTVNHNVVYRRRNVPGRTEHLTTDNVSNANIQPLLFRGCIYPIIEGLLDINTIGSVYEIGDANEHKPYILTYDGWIEYNELDYYLAPHDYVVGDELDNARIDILPIPNRAHQSFDRFIHPNVEAHIIDNSIPDISPIMAPADRNATIRPGRINHEFVRRNDVESSEDIMNRHIVPNILTGSESRVICEVIPYTDGIYFSFRGIDMNEYTIGTVIEAGEVGRGLSYILTYNGWKLFSTDDYIHPHVSNGHPHISDVRISEHVTTTSELQDAYVRGYEGWEEHPIPIEARQYQSEIVPRIVNPFIMRWNCPVTACEDGIHYIIEDLNEIFNVGSVITNGEMGRSIQYIFTETGWKEYFSEAYYPEPVSISDLSLITPNIHVYPGNYPYMPITLDGTHYRMEGISCPFEVGSVISVLPSTANCAVQYIKANTDNEWLLYETRPISFEIAGIERHPDLIWENRNNTWEIPIYTELVPEAGVVIDCSKIVVWANNHYVDCDGNSMDVNTHFLEPGDNRFSFEHLMEGVKKDNLKEDIFSIDGFLMSSSEIVQYADGIDILSLRQAYEGYKVIVNSIIYMKGTGDLWTVVPID